MKYVLLSADNAPSVYAVPDIVANNLGKYCGDFDKWLWESPHAVDYHIDGVVCYDERDFIKYLNTWVFPDELSVWVETLDEPAIDDETNDLFGYHLPERYKMCARFNF